MGRQGSKATLVDDFKKVHNNQVDDLRTLHKMNMPQPAHFEPELTTNRLEMVARWLLEEYYSTEDDLVRDTDNNYTRGCTSFMRQRVRVIQEYKSGRHSWLGMLNNGNDLVFTIGGIPCRYSNDDAASPTKQAVTTANQYQASFLNFDDDKKPSRFCFVIDRGQSGAEEPHVEFLGFTVAGVVVCRWTSNKVRVLSIEGTQSLPPAVEVNKPVVAPKRRSNNQSVSRKG